NEKTGASVNREYLQQLAQDTSGKFVKWSDRHSLLKDIPHNVREITNTREYPVWNRWPWLLIIIALFSAEWYWRRKLDMV
ncbi:MAG: hypothetical protein KAI66_19400, partial [Lentisphaeria bacterium]|nr:hypothetical protein [Lentisphaeria bacterium]